MNSNRELKNARYTAFAEMGKVFANARSLEIIDVLIQRPRSVEEIATSIQQSVASTSQHLQVLKRTKAVNTERQGTTIIYSLAEGTLEVFVAMRKLADAINPSLQVLQQQRSIPSVTFEHVQHVLQESSAVLLDVRTVAEFENGHIEGAINIPLLELQNRVVELHLHQKVIVTCRGPYCVSSDEAAKFLSEKGFSVSRYDDGVGEWCVLGGKLCTTI